VSNDEAGGLVGQTLGGYRLTALLGAGGMAEVYRGEDRKLGRVVAVKVLPRSLAADPEYVRRFRDEATNVSSLDHPNVVKVFAYGEERGLLYLVMPMLVESLREKMDRERLLPLSDSARLVVQIAAALDAAHARGIVHRDVKPENILLNAQGRALLTDFGIARDEEFLRATGSNRTLAATGLPIGTPEYMAPEQLRGTGGDTRIDGYSLGVVLYELLTGSPPFEAKTPYEVASLVLSGQFEAPSERNPLIWTALEHVVLRAMAADPEDRYPDMRTFALALRESVLHRDAQAAARRLSSGRSPENETMPLAPGALDTYNPPDLAARTEAMRPKWRLGVREGTPRSGRPVFLAAAAIALVLVLACALSGFAMLHGLISPGSAVIDGTPTTSTAGTTTDSTPSGDATATYDGPGVTPYPTFTPGGLPTPTGFGTPPGATATPAATQPPSINVSFPDFPAPAKSGFCRGTQIITNNSSFPVDWAWTSIPSGTSNFTFSYTINGQSGHGIPTSQSPLKGNGGQATLFVRFPCTSTPTYTFTGKANKSSDLNVTGSWHFNMKAH
jgi:serine/threonine protein kinase